MEATPAQLESLKTLMREMSAADLSILETVPQTLEQGREREASNGFGKQE